MTKYSPEIETIWLNSVLKADSYYHFLCGWYPIKTKLLDKNMLQDKIKASHLQNQILKIKYLVVHFKKLRSSCKEIGVHKK